MIIKFNQYSNWSEKKFCRLTEVLTSQKFKDRSPEYIRFNKVIFYNIGITKDKK